MHDDAEMLADAMILTLLASDVKADDGVWFDNKTGKCKVLRFRSYVPMRDGIYLGEMRDIRQFARDLGVDLRAPRRGHMVALADAYLERLRWRVMEGGVKYVVVRDAERQVWLMWSERGGRRRDLVFGEASSAGDAALLLVRDRRAVYGLRGSAADLVAQYLVIMKSDKAEIPVEH